MPMQCFLSQPTAAPRQAHMLGRGACIRRPAGARSHMVAASAIKLYVNPRTRSKIVEWYLKELGVQYEAQLIDMDEKEHKGEAYLKVHPFGQLPALQDGELNLFESGAMLGYLADKYGGADTPEQRAEISKWLFFANSTLAYALFMEQLREKQMHNCLQVLDDLLSKQDFLLGSKFTAADAAVGSYLLYVPLYLPAVDLSPYPALLAYMQRLQERPACTIPKPQPAAVAA